MERKDDADVADKMTRLIGLVVQFLTLAIEKEMRVAAEYEDERQHDEQYPGNEIEVWYYTDDFISDWI